MKNVQRQPSHGSLLAAVQYKLHAASASGCGVPWELPHDGCHGFRSIPVAAYWLLLQGNAMNAHYSGTAMKARGRPWRPMTECPRQAMETNQHPRQFWLKEERGYRNLTKQQGNDYSGRCPGRIQLKKKILVCSASYTATFHGTYLMHTICLRPSLV